MALSVSNRTDAVHTLRLVMGVTSRVIMPRRPALLVEKIPQVAPGTTSGRTTTPDQNEANKHNDDD